MKDAMKILLIILGGLLLIAGAIYVETIFVVWVLGLFGVFLTTLQGFGIVAGLYFVAGFFKVTRKKD